MKRLLYGIGCLMIVLSLQGCFFWHTHTDHEPAGTSSTTVVTPS
jgi:hypothetical protein